MGGDDSQKLLPWRGDQLPLLGANLRLNYEINNVTETAPRFARLPTGFWLSYRLPGSFLESTGGSVLARAEERAVDLHKRRCDSEPGEFEIAEQNFHPRSGMASQTLLEVSEVDLRLAHAFGRQSISSIGVCQGVLARV